ncbi:MAG: endosialidase [Clostridium sp.]|nr:endosialidase [Clostridium sp.]
MAVIKELLRSEEGGAISFGNHKLPKKAKVEDFEHDGDRLKVKTYAAITKLEKNGMFLYESVPGTSVLNFLEREDGVEFVAEGDQDVQITLGLTDGKSYEVFVNGSSIGAMKTGLGGKLSLSVELETNGEVPVQVAQVS